MNLAATDRRLMEQALDSLERAGCQFWACRGPDKRPRAGETCHACRAVRALRRRLAKP